MTLNKPEIFIGSCASKFDDKSGQLKDDTTRNFIRQQLEAFAKFIERHGGKAWGAGAAARTSGHPAAQGAVIHAAKGRAETADPIEIEKELILLTFIVRAGSPNTASN